MFVGQFEGTDTHDCIFALPLRFCQSLLQASYQRSITIKYCITVIALQRSPAVSIRSLFFFVSCETKLSHYRRSRDLRCITPSIVQRRLCENATLLAIKQLLKITFKVRKK